jgi:nucleoside-diphosphate-sugar epimerase
MHVLITGAGSFIGKHATVALARAGLQVTASFRSHSPVIDCMRKHLPQTDFTRLDLAREEDYLTLPKKVDAILHIAGLSATPGVTVEEMLACNVTGTRNLIKYAGNAKVVRVVIASTLSVYGDVVDGVITEATPVRNPGVYGASKYLAERLFAAESHWLPCVALRLPGVLGAGAHRAWIPRLLDRIRSSEHVTIYDPRSMFNNAAHVCDLNNFYMKLFKGHWSGFHAFPIGAAGQMSIAAIVKMFISTTGSGSTVTEGAPEKSAFTVSSHYAVRNFSYSPMDIETMLRQYVGESTH